jgi:hypothetical protein
MPIYTLHGCTIEVAKGGRSAKATRHVDKDGQPVQPPETAEFVVIAEKDAPSPQVQAQRWAMGLELQFVAKNATASQPISPQEVTEGDTDLDEANDGE